MSAQYLPCKETEIPKDARFRWDADHYSRGHIVETSWGGWGRAEHGRGDPFKRVVDRGPGGRVEYFRLAQEAE